MRGLCSQSWISVGVLSMMLVACQLPGRSVPERENLRAADDLALIAAELEMHLRDDTYRYGRAVGVDGRNVFASVLWRLDRLQRHRARALDRWEKVDVVIEFARARALERLRRYPEALAAYERAAAAGTPLREVAVEASEALGPFVLHSGQPTRRLAVPEEERDFLDQRIAKWRELAWEFRNTRYEGLAFEELEAWEMLRLEWLAQNDPGPVAVAACERLIERHHESKRYAKHLIRLGDLHAREASGEYMRYRAHRGGFDVEHYQESLDRALSAYELARSEPRPSLVKLAKQKIDELLTAHEAVYADAP